MKKEKNLFEKAKNFCTNNSADGLFLIPDDLIGLKDIYMSGIEDKDYHEYEEQFMDFPWSLNLNCIALMQWEFPVVGPGIGGDSSYSLYNYTSDEGKCYFLESSSYSEWSLICLAKSKFQDINMLFLNSFIRNNGEPFNTGFLGEPPHSISINIEYPWQLLVDIFISAFDHVDAWDDLMDNFPKVYDEEYEEPIIESVIDNHTKERALVDFKKISKEPSGGSTNRRIYSRKCDEYCDNYLLNKYKNLFKNKIISYNIDPMSDENKQKMVMRYLIEVL